MEQKNEELSSQATNESSNNTSNMDTNTGTKKRQRLSFRHIGKILHLRSKINMFAIKCYDEQLINGWDYTCSKIRDYDKGYIVEAICHDKDSYAENGCFWKSALEKRHYHILFKAKDSKERKYVQTIMNELGILFRPQLDDELWKNHGVETVGNFSGYSLYLTHDTEEAIKDGKEQYPIEDVVSNHTVEELKDIRDGYIRYIGDRKKVTSKEMAEIDKLAFNLGYELKDFSAWYDGLEFSIRSNTKMKTVKESYQRGVDKRISENKTVLRLCVFIKGKPNTGKTFASLQALKGKRIHTVEGGGSGKFDNLRPDHEAIVISDDVCPNLLNMADNYICKVYKRQSNNPAWSGNYFIVTSNLDFEEWLEECGIKNKAHIEALKTRFYICEITNHHGENRLDLISTTSRGTPKEIDEKTNMFMEFQKKYNLSLSSYSPNEMSEEDLKHEFYKWLAERIIHMLEKQLPIEKVYECYNFDWWKEKVYGEN